MYVIPDNARSRFSVWQHCAWYRVEHLAEAVRAIRRGNFSIAEQRLQMLTHLNTLMDAAPYSQAQRFPHELYVCEAHGDWMRKLSQLRSALCVKSNNKDEKLRSTVEPADMSDSLQAFNNSLMGIISQLSSNDGVWDRTSFEAYLGVVWND